MELYLIWRLLNQTKDQWSLLNRFILMKFIESKERPKTTKQTTKTLKEQKQSTHQPWHANQPQTHHQACEDLVQQKLKKLLRDSDNDESHTKCRRAPESSDPTPKQLQYEHNWPQSKYLPSAPSNGTC